MNNLHIAIIEVSEECLASYTELGLRQQVTFSLGKRSIPVLTDEEWADCVKGEFNASKTIDCLPFGVISYYKIESRLGDDSFAANDNVIMTAIGNDKE